MDFLHKLERSKSETLIRKVLWLEDAFGQFVIDACLIALMLIESMQELKHCVGLSGIWEGWVVDIGLI